jgi:ankyrin repeat protein
MNNMSKKILNIAALNGDLEIIKLLISNGADVNVADDSGKTPLHFASRQGHTDVVELLIENYAIVKFISDDNSTPLHEAACFSHVKTAELLMIKGAEIDLEIAVMLGNFEIVKSELDRGVSANSKITKGLISGESFLGVASANGHTSICKLLLDYGANVNEKTENFDLSPLHYAIYKNRIDIYELLTFYGADTNAVDKYKDTPLHLASRFGHLSIAKILVNNGANVNSLNSEGNSALFEAARHNQYTVVDYLVSNGANINLINQSGYTPLLKAFQTAGNDETIKILISYGANINVLLPQGYSPLSLAVAQKNKSMVELLLKHGAIVDFS